MKIIIFSNSSWNLLNFRKSLINFLKKKHEVHLVCRKTKYYKLLKKNYKNLHLIEDSSDNMLYSFIYQFFCFYKIVNKISPHLVISFTHKPNIINIITSFLVSRYKSIIVVTGLGSLFIKKKYLLLTYLIKFTYKFSNITIFQNRKDKSIFSLKNTKIISGSGVNLKKFKPKSKFNKQKINFFLISRIIKDKGLYEYFNAANKLGNKKLKFNFVGDFSDENPSRLQKNDFKKLKFLSNVNCYKFRKDVNYYLNKADCIVLPSYREGSSKIILESMAKGLPILGSNVPGIKNLVINNFNGKLFEPKDEESLIRCLIKFSKIPISRRKKMGNRSILLVKKNYSDEIILNQYLKIINNKFS